MKGPECYRRIKLNSDKILKLIAMIYSIESADISMKGSFYSMDCCQTSQQLAQLY